MIVIINKFDHFCWTSPSLNGEYIATNYHPLHNNRLAVKFDKNLKIVLVSEWALSHRNYRDLPTVFKAKDLEFLYEDTY